MPAKLFHFIVLACLLFPASCVSETKTTGPLVWVDNVSYGTSGNQIPNLPPPSETGGEQAAPPEEPSAAAPRVEEPDKIVKVPQDVLDDLLGYINRPQLLLADRIVVDATRIPFKPTIIPIADPNYVETVESGNSSGDNHMFVMRSRQAIPAVERDRPRVRVGEGIDLLADGEIQVRYHRRVSKKRPVYLRIRAVGNAVYRDEETGQRLEKDAITLVAELVPGPGGLVLAHSVQ